MELCATKKHFPRETPRAKESTVIRKYQPLRPRNQPLSGNITRCGQGISRYQEISPVVASESAVIQKYQPSRWISTNSAMVGRK
ncbi:hypothetical protein [Virgibacillus sp. DJP39]|uniref:hypothetical protein n=1 Tax=Virgibacillus sp. DJP39 TaxID=3409790 RepID=UPI003BB69ED6